MSLCRRRVSQVPRKSLPRYLCLYFCPWRGVAVLLPALRVFANGNSHFGSHISIPSIFYLRLHSQTFFLPGVVWLQNAPFYLMLLHRRQAPRPRMVGHNRMEQKPRIGGASVTQLFLLQALLQLTRKTTIFKSLLVFWFKCLQCGSVTVLRAAAIHYGRDIHV